MRECLACSARIRYKAQWYGTRIVEAGPVVPQQQDLFGTCGSVATRNLGRDPNMGRAPHCGMTVHDRNGNAARNLQKLALLAVGEDVTLPDGTALAGGDPTAGETAPIEGRTKPGAAANTQPALGM